MFDIEYEMYHKTNDSHLNEVAFVQCYRSLNGSTVLAACALMILFLCRFPNERKCSGQWRRSEGGSSGGRGQKGGK